jgi:hypothetical protein
MTLPRATMRLQLHKGFTLDDACAVVPYVSALGISHLYLSPILTARPGSPPVTTWSIQHASIPNSEERKHCGGSSLNCGIMDLGALSTLCRTTWLSWRGLELAGLAMALARSAE